MARAPVVASARRGTRPAALRGVAALALLATAAVALAADPIPDLSDRLTTALAQHRSKADIGVAVLDTRDGAALFTKDADQPLKPASVLKLLTTAAALEQFGPDFQFITPLLQHGRELWVIGAGDPGFGDERIARRQGRPWSAVFDDWAAELRRRGVTRADKLVLDDGVFDQIWRNPTWPADQADRWYQAPTGGLNVCDNCVEARAYVANGRATVGFIPALPPSFLRGTVRLGSRNRPILKRALDSDRFQVSGTVTRAGAIGEACVGRPTVFFGHVMKRALADRGIEITGPVVRRAITPAQRALAVTIAEHRTTLRDCLWRCNTFSQNFFAECLVKSLEAYGEDGQPTGQPGSWTGGTRSARQILTGLGVDLSGAQWRDGSGLSHENRVTARQVAQLLVAMYGHPHGMVLRDSLAEPGDEGSLRRRVPALAGRLHAKTGTISGVRALAGYVTRRDGRVLAFAFLGNGVVPRELPLRIAEILAG